MAKIGFIEVDITADISHIRAGLASASSLIRDFSLLSIGLTSGINNAFQKISTIGIRAFQIGLIGITGTLVGATMEGSKFEDAMKRVFIMIGKGSQVAAGDMAMLTMKAEELGRETLFSATEAAEGMVILGRAGFDTGQIFNAITPILELAIATNMDMATTADMVVSSLYGFGKAARDAGHMADVMATIVTGSNETMLDLSNTLSYIAPIASTVGMSVEETGAAIMMLSNAGVRGSKAATGLRAAIAKMLSPTQTEKKLLDELGVSFLTSTGELKDFGDIISELGKSTISTADIFQLFGRRAATAISVLRRMGPSTFREFTSDLERSQGATERMSEEMRKTFIGRVRDLVASIKLLGTTIYDSYRKPLTDATFSLRNLVVEVTKAIKSSRIFETIAKEIEKTFKKFGITAKDVSKKIVDFIRSLTPEKIKVFFEGIREEISKTIFYWRDFGASIKKNFSEISKTLEDLKIDFTSFNELIIKGLEGIGETIPKVIKGAIILFDKLGKTWDSLSDKQKDFIGKVAGVTGALLWLVGGLTPIILLFITLSSVISSLIHIHLAAVITKSLIYIKVLSTLKIALLAMGWAISLVGTAFAVWHITRWIMNLKLFGDGVTTVNDKVTEFFTSMIVGWRVAVAGIKLGALEVAQVFNDYLVGPLNTLSKLMGWFMEIKPFAGLEESIKSARLELDLAIEAAKRLGKEHEIAETAREVRRRAIKAEIPLVKEAGWEFGITRLPPGGPRPAPPLAPPATLGGIRVPTMEEFAARKREMISTGEIVAELRKDAEAEDEVREAFMEYHREERRKSEAFAENLRREMERDKANFEREKALMDTESE